MKRVISLMSLLLVVIFLAGCGETVKGIGKDVTRIGAGVHKVFVSEG